MPSHSTDLLSMIEAAQAAGAALKQRYAQLSELAVRAKSGPADLVSIADEEAERIAHRVLASARPGYGFLGEETAAGGTGDGAQTWIVDPLDGTTNYLYACPLWGVNVALAREGRVVAGVSFLPMLDELYAAEDGRGAWLNGTRIHVSRRATLVEALVSCGIPFNGKPDHDLFVREMARLSHRVSGIRRTGACSVDMAWVASGRWDAYWERAVMAWDMAPGAILVQEAGGRATSATGGPLDLTDAHVCVSNGAIHDALIEQLNLALQGKENA